MKLRYRVILLWSLLLPGLIFLCSNCALPRKAPPGGSSDRAFIVYQPSPNDNTGLRLAVKDLIDIKGYMTTAGSEHLAKLSRPAAEDAECLKIARERGVTIVGKTNLSEFAMGTSGINEYFGTPKNPLKEWRRLIPGGSSSGSAVAIATGAADVALGTDTAGSIRVPAACCGIFGLKTTFGLVSLKGVYPLSPEHLDTIGPMAADIDRLVQGMNLLEREFTSKYRSAVAACPSARSIKIGRLYLPGTNAKIDKAIDTALKAKGFQIKVLDDGFRKKWGQAHKDGNTIAVVDGWLTNRKYEHKSGVSISTKAAMLLGALEYPRAYQAALERRREWQKTLHDLFDEVDFIALPTLQTKPPPMPFTGRSSALFEAEMLRRQNTVAVNYAGNPALAIPVPIPDNDDIPASLQLVGPRLSEAKLLNAGRLIESKDR